MGTLHDDPAEDAELARRIADGSDHDAEALLCRRLLPRIRAYGLRHLSDHSAASDLAQHVVVLVLEALRAGRVEDPGRLAAFVMGACRNTVLDWKKVDRRRGALLAKFGPSIATAVEPEPTTLDRERLTRCLEELRPRERMIVALTYFSERAPDDIARELEMSVGSIRVARHRALGHLHDCITRGEAS
jgi:RNA polymerase sigma-70 factor, ECF subfamily